MLGCGSLRAAGVNVAVKQCQINGIVYHSQSYQRLSNCITNLLHDWVSNQLQDEQSSSLLAVRPMPPSILQIKQLLPIHVSLIVSIKR